MSEFLFSNLVAIRRALEHHNGHCPVPAKAILLHPTDHGLLDQHRLWGVPVRSDDRVPLRRVRVDCGGSAWLAEEWLAQTGAEPGS